MASIQEKLASNIENQPTGAASPEGSVVLIAADRADSVERLMGTKAEARFAFIQEKAEFASEAMLDV